MMVETYELTLLSEEQHVVPCCLPIVGPAQIHSLAIPMFARIRWRSLQSILSLTSEPTYTEQHDQEDCATAPVPTPTLTHPVHIATLRTDECWGDVAGALCLPRRV